VRRAVDPEQADRRGDRGLHVAGGRPLKRGERFERALVANLPDCHHGIVL
jgi:hypothetical protein